VNGLRYGPAIALCAGALVAAIASCSSRPLPFRDGDGAAGGRGGSGDAGSGGSMTGIGGGRGLQLIGAPRLLLDSPSNGPELHTTLLWTGEEYLFVWRLFDGDGVFMQRLDASGQTIGGNMRLLASANAVDLAWGGDRLAAVWNLTNAPAGPGLFFQTFDRLARPLTAEVKLRSSASSGFDGSTLYGPRIAPIRDGFAIAWNEGQVLVATVTVDGHAQHGPEAAGGDDLRGLPHLSLAARGDRIVVGWNGRPSGTPQPALPTNMMVTRAFSDRLQPLGSRVVLDAACLAGGTHQLLATGGGLLALWTREATGIAPIAIAQLDADGVPTTTATMESPVVGRYQDPAPAAWNGDHLVVLWDRSTSTIKTGLTLARFSPDGTVQGQPVALPTMAVARHVYLVAHDGTVGFIWSEEIDGAYEVYFQQARSVP
jgi:hypothetical protein